MENESEVKITITEEPEIKSMAPICMEDENELKEENFEENENFNKKEISFFRKRLYVEYLEGEVQRLQEKLKELYLSIDEFQSAEPKRFQKYFPPFSSYRMNENFYQESSENIQDIEKWGLNHFC
jgi:hypothetical protein